MKAYNDILAFLLQCHLLGKMEMFLSPLKCRFVFTEKNSSRKGANLLGQKQLAIRGLSQHGKLQ